MPRAFETVDAPIGKLQVASFNPRKIRDPRFEQLKRSMVADPEMLQARPVIALPNGTVVAGNMRLKAAQTLGWDTIPTIYVDLDDRRAREWMIRDNNGFGEWVEDDLGTLLADLKAAGSDIDLLGFDSPELDRLLKGVTQVPEEDEADLEPPAEPITKPGDLWLLGEHRLLCGDSTNITDVERLMNELTPPMLLTDPPYGLGGYAGRSGHFAPMTGDDATVSDIAQMIAALPSLAHRFIWTDWRAYPSLVSVLGIPDAAIVWSKPWPGMGKGYRGQYEMACYYGDFAASDEFDLWSVDYSAEGVHSTWQRTEHINLHPTQKPVELFARAIRNHTVRGDTVLDLFGGSGSTLIAAEQTGRVAYLMEIDPGYVQVILERWAKLTGKDPIRDDGMSFRSLKAVLPCSGEATENAGLL